MEKLKNALLAVLGLSVLLLFFLTPYLWDYFTSEKITTVKGWCSFALSENKGNVSLRKDEIREDLVKHWQEGLEFEKKKSFGDGKVNDELNRLSKTDVVIKGRELHINEEFSVLTLEQRAKIIQANLSRDHEKSIRMSLKNNNENGSILNDCIAWGTDFFFSKVVLKNKEKSIDIKTNKYHIVKKHMKDH